MKFQFVKGSTSLILTVFIQDSSSTTGAGLGSLDQTSSIVGGFVRMGGTGVALAVDENVTTEGTYQAPTTAAQVRIGTPANLRTGDYELHFHNDLFASGADYVYISLGGAANMADLRIEIQLTDFNLNDASPEVTLAAETHTGAVVPTVSTLTGHTPQTGDSYTRLGAPSGGSMSVDVADIPTVSEFNARTRPTADYFDQTTDPVELLDSAGTAGTSAAELIDDIWDEAAANHPGAGTLGKLMQDLSLSSEISALNDLTAAQVNAQVDTALTDIKLDKLLAAAVAGADVTDDSIFAKLVSKSATADWDTFINTTDALEALRDRGDTAWITGAGGSPPDLLQNTTIATLASQTSFTLTAGSADDTAYEDQVVVVTDSATSTQKAVGFCSAYTGATKTITLLRDPGVFTMAVGDTVDIIANPMLALRRTETMPELPVGQPPATPTEEEALMQLYMPIRDKRVVDRDNATDTIYNDAGTAIMKSDITNTAGVTTIAKKIAP